MNDTKHTPGPWLVRQIHDEQVDVVKGDFPKGHAIATISTWGDAELIANAHLIAAAPELLAACEQALRESGCDGDLCGWNWHDIMRAAIAKATSTEES